MKDEKMQPTQQLKFLFHLHNDDAKFIAVELIFYFHGKEKWKFNLQKKGRRNLIPQCLTFRLNFMSTYN